MDDELKIHLLIDNVRYPITILRKDEQLYRDAAKKVNDTLNQYREKHKDCPPQAYWAMTAFSLAFKVLSIKDRNDTAPYREKLKEMTEEIEQYLTKKEQG